MVLLTSLRVPGGDCKIHNTCIGSINRRNQAVHRPALFGHTSRSQSILPFRKLAAVKDSQQQHSQIESLLGEIKGSERGSKQSAEQKERILKAVEALEESARDQRTTGPEVNATWKLLWTTEKETLFILKNASWFRTEAGDVFQVIDTDNGFLQNVITFNNGSSFVVDSSLENGGQKRLVFKFSAARLNTSSRSWKIPPFGKGWFDTTFLGEGIRIARDIRGDTLIVQHDGSPRKF